MVPDNETYLTVRGFTAVLTAALAYRRADSRERLGGSRAYTVRGNCGFNIGGKYCEDLGGQKKGCE